MVATITGINPTLDQFKPRISPLYKTMSISASSMSTPPRRHTEPPYVVDALNRSFHKEETLQFTKASLENCLSETNLHLTVPGLSSKTRGKVRDIYGAGDHLVLVTADQQSAFDRVLASIPFKGQRICDWKY